MDDKGQFTKGSIAMRQQRVRWCMLFKGDIRDKTKIVFPAKPIEQGGMSDGSIIEMFETEAPLAVVARVLKFFPRHRWFGAKEVIQETLVFAGTHALMEEVIPEWLGSAVVDTVGNVVDPNASGYVSDDEHDESLFRNAAALVDGVQDRTFFQRMHGNAKLYSLMPRPCVPLVIMLKVGEPMMAAIASAVFQAGEKWMTLNNKTTLKGGRRKFRILESARNTLEKDCAARCAVLAGLPSEWLSLPCTPTLSDRSLAFRMLSREVGYCHSMLYTLHRAPPFQTFMLLDGDPETTESIKKIRRCGRDDWTDDHFNRFEGEIDGPDSLGVLETTAEHARDETTRAECAHGYWQREVRAKSLMVNAETLPGIGATTIMHGVLMMEKSAMPFVPRTRNKKGRRPKARKVKLKKARTKRPVKTKPRRKRKRGDEETCIDGDAEEPAPLPKLRRGAYRQFLAEQKLSGELKGLPKPRSDINTNPAKDPTQQFESS